MRIMQTKQKDRKCAMCKRKLFDSNVARYREPGTYRNMQIRLDSLGREWCQACTDEFDNIEWNEESNR